MSYLTMILMMTMEEEDCKNSMVTLSEFKTATHPVHICNRGMPLHSFSVHDDVADADADKEEHKKGGLPLSGHLADVSCLCCCQRWL